MQPPYSLFWRKIENEIQPYCVENNIYILAYSSLAQGLLTGKLGPDYQFSKDDNRSSNKLFADKDNYARVQTALDKLRPIAERNQCTLAQLSLAWLIAQPQTNAIVGARHEEQSQQNARASEIKLSKSDLDEIDSIGRIVTDPLDESLIMWDF